MQLVEAGKLNLEVSVQQYLPWFRTNDPQASAQITIRNLLYNTSDFPPTRGLETFHDGDYSDRTLEQEEASFDRNCSISNASVFLCYSTITILETAITEKSSFI